MDENANQGTDVHGRHMGRIPTSITRHHQNRTDNDTEGRRHPEKDVQHPSTIAQPVEKATSRTAAETKQ